MNKSRGLFWIKGCPGTGKSVLMKFAVEMMSRRKSGELIVSFFIHGRGVPLQKTPLGMLRALLSSLLMSFPTYLAELTERFQDQQQRYGSYEQQNGWRWNEKELEKILFRLLTKGTKSQPVVVFVDALDECGEEHAKGLLGYFKRLMEIAEREGSMVKICFSSRHFPILGHEIMSRVYVEEKNDRDIRQVIEDRLREIQPDERRRQIENEILLKAHGGFQWAILITNMILDEDAIGARTEDLLSMISSIPPDLDELYNVILNAWPKDKHNEMEKLFQWVLFAERPLSAQELREALSTDKDMACTTVSQLRSHENWSDSVSRFETRVRYISRGLVEFQDRDVYEQYEPGGEEWNREAQFIHQSAADFITQRFFTHSDGESMIGSSAGSGHYEISRSFLKYLALEEILHGGGLSRGKLSATFPLMPYGISFVLRHVRAVEAEGIPQNDLIELIQWDQPERLKMLAAIWRIMDPEGIHAPRGWPFVGATVLHHVAAFGSASLLDTFLQKDTSDLAHQDCEGNTPLHLALRENNQDLALMILGRSRTWQTEQYEGLYANVEDRSMQRTDYLAHINVTNHNDETPLTLAVSVRADIAIQILVDAGAEVKHEKSLVFYAISTENRTLLSKLIEGGADLAGAVFFAIQCLDRAYHCDDILYGFLRDLLEAGADTKRFVGSEIDGYDEADESDDEDEDEDEAIFLALRHGRLHAINFLSSRVSSVTLTNSMGDTPLITAIRNQHFEAAKVLIHASPQTELWKHHNGDTPLDILIEVEKSEAVAVELIQLLMDKGDGHLKFQKVVERLLVWERKSVVEDLLKEERNLVQLTKSTDHDSALLFTAVHRSYPPIVSLVLESGNINMSVRDKGGNTTLNWAVIYGDAEMVSLLLRLDTEQVLVSEQDKEGYTPLHRAIVDEDEDMAKLLLDTRYVDSSQQPFLWAIQCGSLRMVKFFLEEDIVDINQEDEDGQTPLWWAIESESSRIFECLLGSTSIDLHVRNKDGQTTLCLAVENSEDLVIQWMLESEKFDIDKEDNETIQKAAFWAMEHDDEETIRLLLRSSSFSTHEGIEKVVRVLASWAVKNEKLHMLQLLFEDKGFNLRTEDEKVINSLFWLAVGKGNEGLVHLIHNSGKFEVNTKDRLGKTPLMHATEACAEEALKFLLRTGKVDVRATDNEGNTALSIALLKGYKSIADLLSAHIWTTEMVTRPTEVNVTRPTIEKEY
jgi:ankyrin repeat protein